MRTLALGLATAVTWSASVMAAAPPATRFTAPLQPFASADGRVHLLRPAVARISSSDRPVGALTSGGWRLVWDGASATPGRLVVRLALPVAPAAPQTRATEFLQVGMSRDREAVRSCLTFGFKGGSNKPRPDRVINGQRFKVWTGGDAGMSQRVDATDLRTVADGACYAVERFSYGDTASERDPSITLPQAQGAAMLDQALASLQLGRISAGHVKRPSTLRSPRGAVAY